MVAGGAAGLGRGSHQVIRAGLMDNLEEGRKMMTKTSLKGPRCKLSLSGSG